MTPENSEITMAVSRSLVLCLSLIIYTSPVLADDRDDQYNQLADSNQENAHYASAPRLSDLLRWKDSLSDILPQHPAADNMDSNNSASVATSQQMKRVIWCNGFTGCARNVKDRKRHLVRKEENRQRPVRSKRPFCNSYGCFNSGRKRSLRTTTEERHKPAEAEDQRVATDMWPWARIKKLFCNGYGGCQNMGKRLQARPDSSDSTPVGSEHPMDRPFSKESLHSAGGNKRFFTGGYEDDVNALIDEMKR
ncbi:hypothetical protein BsWGS_00138 [Bradybaena similaris]